MNGPQDRLDLLLRAYRAAGSFTVDDLAKQVSLHPNSLTPGRRRILAESAQRAIARAAAMLLALDPDQVERWAFAGAKLATVEARLAELASAELPRLCRACETPFAADDPDFDPVNGMCLPCRRAYQRALKTPAAANYLDTLRANLDAIRKECLELAGAVERFDARVTVTYQRLAEEMGGGWRAAKVGEILQGLGLGKPRLNAERGESPNKNVASGDSRSTGKKKSSTGYRKASFPSVRRWRSILTAARAFRSAARRPHSRRPAGLYDPRRRQLQGSALRALPSLRAEVLQ